MTVSQLALLTRASPRTVRYDLDDLARWLAPRGVTLVRRPRRGVWLEGELRPLGKAVPRHEAATADPFLPSPQRQALTAARLLATEAALAVRELTELLGVTRATVYRELDRVGARLKKRSLALERTRSGIRISGGETSRRWALYELLREWVLDADLREESSGRGSLDAAVGVRLLRELTARSAGELRALVADAAEAAAYPLTPAQAVGLLFWSAISEARLRVGCSVQLPERAVDGAGELAEHRLAVEVLRRLGFPGDHQEAAFLAMTARDARYGPSELRNLQAGRGRERARQAALEFTRQAGCLLGVRLEGDEDLIRGLVLHLEPALDRLELGVVTPNPLLDEIKAKYSGLFAVARQAAESLALPPSGLAEEEIGYLAMHLGAALERLAAPGGNVLRAVLVCEHGVGTAQLLASMLASRLPELLVCGFASSHEVERVAAECQADVVITTRPLAAAPLPAFLVHPLPDVIELVALRTRLQSLLRRPRTDRPLRTDAINGGAAPLMLEHVLTHDTVALDVEARDWQEAIRKAGELMVATGAVRPEYVEGMIRSVLTIGPYVVVGPGIAMPHARPEDGAVRVGMSCVRLARPVVFANKVENPVDLVFAFAAIDNQSHLTVMGQLAELLSTPPLVERIRRAKTVEDVLEVVHAVSAT